uniref:Uncharacterized protein n=1 Tax=Eustigmatophyceae sp. Ndem 8/9T-3m6.8 TaxID=2506146 RepID=A0A410D282_9STRA|nr:hypothetical protein [Eustigmatophyceae sp. Ndem 8/9T-3m6.8]QAA11830.1 hypothetical protein [Eustigmatophyceae sp. Ndem 8/9T-3m6.8]
MYNVYLQNFYKNPFRSRHLTNDIDQEEMYEIFEKIRNNLYAFLDDDLPFDFSYIPEWVDEFGNFKLAPYIHLPRLKIPLTKMYVGPRLYWGEKVLPFFKSLIQTRRINFHLSNKKTWENLTHFYKSVKKQNYIQHYEEHLRYLDLPVQPLTDPKGFEVQLTTNDILEEAIENVQDGYTFVYDYCSKMFPETTELLDEHCYFEPDVFPNIILEGLYEAIYHNTYLFLIKTQTNELINHPVHNNLRKSPIKLYKWFVSGDIDTKLLSVIKPKPIQITRYHYSIILLESFLCLIVFLWLSRWLIRRLIRVTINLQPQIQWAIFKEDMEERKIDMYYDKFRFIQQIKKLKSKILDLKPKFKYRILKILSTESFL